MKPKSGENALKKKFKRKKAKNIQERKQKGLHLNKVDRRKLKKQAETTELRANITKRVREELDELEEKSLSSLSESSFGSQPLKKSSKKRVSFGEKHVKVFDKNDHSLEIRASEATPGKSILASNIKKRKLEKKSKKPREDKSEMESIPATEEKKIKKLGEGVTKGKKKITVPKSLKEKLLALPKKERKKILMELKAKKKPYIEKAVECKKLWEKVRSSKTPTADKEKAIEELTQQIKGHARQLIYSHDTCRVIQCLASLNRPSVNNILFDELSPEIVRMAKSKYARFFVTKMLKYGNKNQRERIISAFRGHAPALFRVTWAAEVLETAFNDYANAQQRWNIISEFYGNEFLIFQSTEYKSLDDLLEKEPGKKKQIMKHLEEIVMDVVEKTTLKLSITHKLMHDLVRFGTQEQIDNLIDSIKTKIPELVHTPDGSKVAMHCIWNSSAKDRKIIVKNMKGLAVNCAMEEYGCRVLMSILDTVDDTVLVNKYITQDIANEIRKVVLDKFGIRVVHYMVHPRDGRVMDKGVIDLIKQGDSNVHSKKAASDRYSELFNCLSKPLFTFMAANMELLLTGGVATANLVLDSLELPSESDPFPRTVSAEDRAACYAAMTEIASREFVPCEDHLIEHKQGQFVIGRLLRGDGDLPEDQKLSTHLARLPRAHLGSWVGCNKGCFTLLRMFENGSEETRKKVRESVDLSRLRGYSTAGARILLESLQA